METYELTFSFWKVIITPRTALQIEETTVKVDNSEVRRSR